MKILIFIDKLSSSPTKDEEDTLIEANEVKSALVKLGHNVIISNFDFNLNNNLEIINKESPNLIFNLVETLEGSSTLHIAPLLFEKKEIKYTGGTSSSLFLTGDKILGKYFFKSLNIKYPKFYYKKSNKVSSSLINSKVIVKQIDQEASCGIDDNCVTTFKNSTEIRTFIKKNPNMFIEEYIEGKEFNVSVLSIDSKIIVLPIAKMEFNNFPKDKPQILNYKSKWDEDSFEYKNTNRTFNLINEDQALIKKMSDISKKCYIGLGRKGYLRVDFRVDKNNIAYVLEVNINPCITHDSGFVAAANQYGISYEKLINYIINEEENG